ncbi:MAG: hypothetical protein ACJ8LL_06225 [Candidatus Udaeobacter sp.]
MNGILRLRSAALRMTLGPYGSVADGFGGNGSGGGTGGGGVGLGGDGISGMELL